MPSSSKPESPLIEAPLIEEGAAASLQAAKAAFFLRMRARGIGDLAVLRGFERVARADFVEAPYTALAARDVPLPLPCGQTMPEPWLLARMIEALQVAPQHHVLEIGSGSGYGTAILATIASDVIGIERYQTLARAAQARLAALEIVNAAIVWGDGLALPPRAGPFERIMAHGILEAPHRLLDRLAPGGRLVCALMAEAGPQAAVITHDRSPQWLGPCALAPVMPGRAAAL